MEFSGFQLILYGFIIQLTGLIGNLLFQPLTTKKSSTKPRISIKLNDFFNNTSRRERVGFFCSYVLIFGLLFQAVGFVASINENFQQTGKLLSEIDEVKNENTRLWDEIYDLKNKIKFGLIGPEYNE